MSVLIPQLLIALSMAVAGMQDLKWRAVNDLVWAPAAGGGVLSVTLALLSIESSGITASVWGYFLKVGVFVPLAIAAWLLLRFGQADAIALIIVAFDPYPQSFLFTMVGFGLVFAVHSAWLAKKGLWSGKRVISHQEFLLEHKWIPVALIDGDRRVELPADVEKAFEAVEKAGGETKLEVKYGVPQVTYLAAGYIGYVVYLLISNPALFFSLP